MLALAHDRSGLKLLTVHIDGMIVSRAKSFQELISDAVMEVTLVCCIMSRIGPDR